MRAPIKEIDMSLANPERGSNPYPFGKPKRVAEADAKPEPKKKGEYNADLERRIRAHLDEEGIEGETVEELLQAVPTAYQWGGLDRYWRKKAEREAAA